MSNMVFSKVLLLDNCPECEQVLKGFCDENHLIGLRVTENNLMQVLAKNIDLGAIFLSENYGGSLEKTAIFAREIRFTRPELPIVLRRENQENTDDLPPELQRLFCSTYSIKDLSPLHKVLEDYIFSIIYPNALVRGIAEIAEPILCEQFRVDSLSWETPYIVRDRIIYGEVFSLMQLESSWCRGYMMLQMEEAPFFKKFPSPEEEMPNFRLINSVLGEITNLIWGSFKNRYIGNGAASQTSKIQVPLIINHKNKYISFGTENPQLCFRGVLNDQEYGEKIKFDMRFIFNLSWSPEDFEELTPDVDTLVATGELDLF